MLLNVLNSRRIIWETTLALRVEIIKVEYKGINLNKLLIPDT